MKVYLSIAKALADDARARILVALTRGELCVCEIAEMLGLAMSTVSRHLSILYGAGLIEARKDSRWVYYRLAGKNAPKPVRAALKWVMASLDGSPVVKGDENRLSIICRPGKDGLCAKK